MNNTDNFIKDLIKLSLESDVDWLTCSLKKAQVISDDRDGTAAYGFEWLIHTALAFYLFENKATIGAENIRVGQKDSSGCKIDLSFRKDSQDIVLQLKTIAPGGIAYAKSDVLKKYAENSLVYFCVSCCLTFYRRAFCPIQRRLAKKHKRLGHCFYLWITLPDSL